MAPRIIWDELPLLDLVVVILTVVMVILTFYTSGLLNAHLSRKSERDEKHQELVSMLRHCAPCEPGRPRPHTAPNAARSAS